MHTKKEYGDKMNMQARITEMTCFSYQESDILYVLVQAQGMLITSVMVE